MRKGLPVLTKEEYGVRPLEVKKLENGSLAVRWSNEPKKWFVVEDKTMIQFIIFSMALGRGEQP